MRYVAPAEIAHLDAELRSFRNINTPQEWSEALAELTRRLEAGLGVQAPTSA